MGGALRDVKFSNPSGIAVDSSGNVYIAEMSNHRVQKFTSGGVFVTKWGGSSEVPLSEPSGVAVDSSGNVYVADTGSYCVQKFTSGGVFITKWGSEGSDEDQFDYPFAIAIDSSGNVYVANFNSGRVQKFVPTNQQKQIATIKVIVVDGDGKPVPSATVSSTSQPAGQTQLSGVTGTDGFISFSLINQGSYTMQVSKTGYVTSTTFLDVIAGGSSEASVSLQAVQSPTESTKGNTDSIGGIPSFSNVAVAFGVLLCVAWVWMSNRENNQAKRGNLYS